MAYKIELDRKKCVGCGSCVNICPENFELQETEEGYKAKPKKTIINDNEYPSNKEAEENCPVGAIKITKTD